MILTEAQALVRDTARQFAQTRVLPNTRYWEQQQVFPPDVLREMGELGFLGMTVAEEDGGSGLDYVSYALALIEVAAADGALSTLMSVNNAPVCAILSSQGSPEQKQRFLRPLARGEMIGAFALTEAHAGSDAARIKMQAQKVEGGYKLNGSKQYITSGSIAGVTITFAVTDPSAEKRGISAFLVPRGTPGFRVARIESKLGQIASDTAQLDYDNVFISDEQRIGEEGEGYRIALANLEAGRIGIAAQSVGMARAALEIAVRYATERQAFGKVLREHQAVLFKLADMSTEIMAAEQMVLHAAALRDAQRPCLREACMAKLFASEAAERVCSQALQILGGYGYTTDSLVEKIYRDVRVCQIYEGTSDIQRILIGRAI